MCESLVKLCEEIVKILKYDEVFMLVGVENLELKRQKRFLELES